MTRDTIFRITKKRRWETRLQADRHFIWAGLLLWFISGKRLPLKITHRQTPSTAITQAPVLGGKAEATECPQRASDFNLSNKGHYYDPETTTTFCKKLAWVLSCFILLREFQYIAQYLADIQD